MEGTLWILLGFLATQCSGKTLRKETFDIPEPNPSLYDDIRLAPEQEMQVKERGFYTPGKWPMENNLVTVPYYFDEATVPADSIVRTNFKKAADIYEAQTCIRWVEVPSTDARHKVRVFRDGGCWSYVGRVNAADNQLSLGSGCEQIGTMLHEMGHCMGLFHTQSRPDRDQYVRVWLNNVEEGMEHNFDKSDSDVYDVPYDYKSMMHYGNSYFTKDGSFTLTTIDPFAMFAIGSRVNTFRYSDAAFLNRAYTCDKINAAKCSNTTCINGGFVTQDCKCRCPENTVGDRCETVTGPFFSDVPTCGGTVTDEGEISSFINGWSTMDRCIFAIEAPECQLPSITFTHAKFFWDQCYTNKVIVQLSSSYFGFTFCKEADVPFGKPLIADSNKAYLYSVSNYAGSREYGFKANINFVADPACGGTTRPTTTGTGTTTTRTRTTTTTTPTTTTPPPATSCVLTELGTNSFKYTTEWFPRAVAPNTKCSYLRKPAKYSDLIFTKVQISLRLGSKDPITIGDNFYSYKYQGGSMDLVAYYLWPINLDYTAGSTPGNGFSVTHTPVTGLPTPCNGETLTMSNGESRTFKNPLEGFTEKSVPCAFKIVAPAGRKMSIQGIKMGLTSGEELKIKPYTPTYDTFYDMSTNVMRTWSNIVIVYYRGSTTYTGWEIKVTVV